MSQYVVIIKLEAPGIAVHDAATLAEAEAIQKKHGGAIYELRK